MRSLLREGPRSVLSAALKKGTYRPSTKKALDSCLELCGEELLEEDDNSPGVYRPTDKGEAALEKWNSLPGKAA